jgi:hypothetical protein
MNNKFKRVNFLMVILFLMESHHHNHSRYYFLYLGQSTIFEEYKN